MRSSSAALPVRRTPSAAHAPAEPTAGSGPAKVSLGGAAWAAAAWFFLVADARATAAAASRAVLGAVQRFTARWAWSAALPLAVAAVAAAAAAAVAPRAIEHFAPVAAP